MYCPQCHLEYRDQQSCPRCGPMLTARVAVLSTAQPRSCPACGRTSALDAKFCLSCGHDIAAGPRVCRACGTIVPLAAKFCGECSAAVTDAAEKTKFILASPLPPQTVAGPSPDAQTAKTGAAFHRWSRQPWLQVSIELTLLLIVAFVAYQLGWHRAIEKEGGPTPSSVIAAQSEAPTKPQDHTPPPEKATGSTEDTPAPVVAATGQTENSGVQSSSPPPVVKPYVVRTATALRDKPTWRGKELVRLEPGTQIQMKSTVGDWLSVEFGSDQPSGYVWHEDATPE